MATAPKKYNNLESYHLKYNLNKTSVVPKGT